MATMRRERLAEVFVELADTLVDDFDLMEFLQVVASRTAELVQVAAVGLLLADAQGQLQFMAASDEQTKILELFQVQHHQGPCLDAFRTRTTVVETELRTAGDRWPLFAPRAAALGFASVHALPLRLRTTMVGALNLFGTGTGALDPEELRVVQALGDIATIGLLQVQAVHRGEVLTEQLQGALNSRVVIEQAKGALAQMHGIDVDRAFTLMRSFARNRNRKLLDVAHDVVSQKDVPGLTRR